MIILQRIHLKFWQIFKFTMQLAIYLGGPASLAVAGFLTGTIVLFGVILFFMFSPIILLTLFILDLFKIKITMIEQ